MGIKVPAGFCHACLTKVEGKAKWCPTHRPPPKYRSTETQATIAGEVVVYKSRKEAARHADLMLMEEHGLIANLRTQVRYPLVVNGVKVAVYVADFVYDEGGQCVVEDAKGFRTRVYRMKARLFRACHGFSIREV